ncbi:hypothetical protein DPMN_180291 [Dreissena polymorpha]|uniref:Mutator-like transposase domain-containing protein n=1 Tax=Dreissena polymorpha TaxID=45954 RepID=A0A9D4IN06_DREPO|nr:hypothetical protein DPMN_180291 [Dreissena polymorpha]
MFSRGCMEMSRDNLGRFSTRSMSQHDSKYVKLDHGYSSTSDNVPQSVNEPWKIGRRLVEWDVLLSNLQFCKECGLGPVPLTTFTIQGELQKGLSGFLYVKCTNHDCGYINTAAYGKTYCEPSSQGRAGMPCFVVNTKLGSGKQFSIS